MHPNGTKLAIGFYDTTAVEVYDGHTLNWLYAADTGGICGGDLSRVAWSADGARLYAGVYPADGSPIVIWQDEGRGKRSGSAAVARRHHAAFALRRRHRGRGEPIPPSA